MKMTPGGDFTPTQNVVMAWFVAVVLSVASAVIAIDQGFPLLALLAMVVPWPVLAADVTSRTRSARK